MAEHLNLYQRAMYYDIVFDRDVSRETVFIGDVYQRYTGRELESVLDIACGPGYHARDFARRGVRSVGLDLREEMIDFAKAKDAEENVAIEWLAADMRDFSLSQPVDVAFIVFDGIDALQTNLDLVAHFRAVASNLTERGLYLIDLTHPRDCSYESYGQFRYAGSRQGTSVEINWAVNQPKFDWVTGLANVDVEMRITPPGGDEFIIRDTATERMLMPQEFYLLAELSGMLEVAGWYGDFDLDVSTNDLEARRMIIVMQKKDI